MKKTIVILSIFFLSISCYAQKFIDLTKVWIIEAKGFSDGHYWPAVTCFYKFIGDTIIENRTYTKMYSSINQDRSDWKLSSLWREDESEKIVWSYLSTGETLMYDFNMVVGDTIKKNSRTRLDAIVDSVVIKPFGSKLKKHLYCHTIDIPTNSFTWIEGIGSLFNPNVPDDFWVTGGTSKLICFEENGALVYHNPNYPNCFFTSSQSLKNDQNFVDLFSMQNGEIQIRLKNNAQGELFLYTVDGKQVLNKELRLSTTTICVPTGGILLYRFIGKGGEVQTGKVLVK